MTRRERKGSLTTIKRLIGPYLRTAVEAQTRSTKHNLCFTRGELQALSWNKLVVALARRYARSTGVASLGAGTKLFLVTQYEASCLLLQLSMQHFHSDLYNL